MARPPRDRPHLHLDGGGQSEPYTSPRLVITGLPPARVRAAHARQLERAMGRALTQARQRLAARDDSVAEGERGFYLQFEFPVAERAAVEGLENKPKAIELVAVRPPADGDELVSPICLLDSGANRAHPLIEPALRAADQHAYEDSWGVGDSAYWNGHGTAMAGVALYGDLEKALSGMDPVALRHRLETVKILPPGDQNEPELYGAITDIGVAKAEAQSPRRHRVFCMAVTSEVGWGRPAAPDGAGGW